jgi:hypothetical protein
MRDLNIPKEDKPYVDKIYDVLKDNLDPTNTFHKRTPEEFKEKMLNDSAYVATIYDVLKGNLAPENSFHKKSRKDFYNEIGGLKKKVSTSESSGPGTSLSKGVPTLESSTTQVDPIKIKSVKEAQKDGFKSIEEFEAHQKQLKENLEKQSAKYLDEAAKHPDIYVNPKVHKSIRENMIKKGYTNAQTEQFVSSIKDVAQEKIDKAASNKVKAILNNKAGNGDEAVAKRNLYYMHPSDLEELKTELEKDIDPEIVGKIINDYQVEHTKKVASDEQENDKRDPKEIAVDINIEGLKALGEDDRKLAEHNQEMLRLRQEIKTLGDTPEELQKKKDNYVKLSHMSAQIPTTDKDQLYSFETGQYIARKDASQFEIEDDAEVKQLADKFEKSDLDKLTNSQKQIYYQRKAITDEFEGKTTTISHYSGANVPISPKDISTAIERGKYNNEYSLDEETIKQAEALREKWKDINKKWYAVNRALYKNEDPATVEKSLTTASGWKNLREIGNKAFWEHLSMDEGLSPTDRDFRKQFVEALTLTGGTLTKDQKAAAVDKLYETLDEAGGSLIPVVGETILAMYATEGLAAIPEAKKAIDLLRALSKAKFGKAGEFIFNVAERTAKSSASFAIAPSDELTAPMGAGFGLTAGVLGNINKSMTGKWGPVVNFGTQMTAGTGTGIIGMYSAEYLDNLSKAGVDYEEAFKRTFGRDMEEAEDKFVVTALIASMLSFAHSAGLLTEAKRKVQEMPNGPKKTALTEALNDAEGTKKGVEKPVDKLEDINKTPESKKVVEKEPVLDTKLQEYFDKTIIGEGTEPVTKHDFLFDSKEQASEMVTKSGTETPKDAEGATVIFEQDGNITHGTILNDVGEWIFKPKGEGAEIILNAAESLMQQGIIRMPEAEEAPVVAEGESVVQKTEVPNEYTIRDKKYTNDFSKPEMAINRDVQGNIISVTLTGEKGPRTFRNEEIVDEIAYDALMQEHSKDGVINDDFAHFVADAPTEPAPKPKRIKQTDEQLEKRKQPTKQSTTGKGEIQNPGQKTTVEPTKQIQPPAKTEVKTPNDLANSLSDNSKELSAGFGERRSNYTTKDGVEVTLKEDLDEHDINGNSVQADVELDFIGINNVKNRGKGLASKEMDRILSEADKNDLSISLMIDSEAATSNVVGDKLGEKGLSDEQLKKFYESKGFIFDDSPYGYRPAKSEQLSKFKRQTYIAKKNEVTLDNIEFIPSPEDLKISFSQGDLKEDIFYEDGSDRIWTVKNGILKIVDNVRYEYNKDPKKDQIIYSDSDIIGDLEKIKTAEIKAENEKYTKELEQAAEPIIDEMVKVEVEMSNRGFEIDTSYDNETLVTDKKTGELVEPEDIPADMKKLVGQYENAAGKIGDKLNIAVELKKGRERFKGEEVEAVEVKNELPPKKGEVKEPEFGIDKEGNVNKYFLERITGYHNERNPLDQGIKQVISGVKASEQSITKLTQLNKHLKDPELAESINVLKTEVEIYKEFERLLPYNKELRKELWDKAIKDKDAEGYSTGDLGEDFSRQSEARQKALKLAMKQLNESHKEGRFESDVRMDIKKQINKIVDAVAKKYEGVKNIKDVKPKEPVKNELPAKKEQPVEEASKKETDPATINELKNSLQEGEMILKSGKKNSGEKMSKDELAAVQRSVDKTKERLGIVDKPAVADLEKTTDDIYAKLQEVEKKLKAIPLREFKGGPYQTLLSEKTKLKAELKKAREAEWADKDKQARLEDEKYTEFTINAKNPVSKSGRKLTPVPTIKGTRKPANTAWSNWLIENAKEEVKSNDYQTTLIKSVSLLKDGSLNVSDGYMLNELLFGDPYAKIDWGTKAPEKVKPTENVIQVKKWKQGDGGTKGVFQGKDGTIYKSVQPQEWVMNKSTKQFEKAVIKGTKTDEFEILSELQGNPHVPKIGKMVETSEGPAFEIEQLQEINPFNKKPEDLKYRDKDIITLEEYKEAQRILDDLNDKGYFVGDKVTIMKRPETGDIVVTDFSHGYKESRGERDENMLIDQREWLNKNDQAILRYESELSLVDMFWEKGKAKAYKKDPHKIKSFQYRMTQRPPSIGTHPIENLTQDWLVKEGTRAKDGYHAIIEYTKPMSTEEMKRYELRYEGRGKTEVVVEPSKAVESATQETTPPQTKPLTEEYEIKKVKVSDIKTDEAEFQNRVELDQERVDKMAEKWDWTDFDPVKLWNNNGELTLISGHHRFAAAKKAGIKELPSKIFEGTKAEAIEKALDSNTTGKAETNPERADRYRKMREKGRNEVFIKDKIKEAHGKDATAIYNLSFLDPKGKALSTINSFGKSGEVATMNKVNAVADWIGAVKATSRDISRTQENEMYDFLMSPNSSKITSREDFRKHMLYHIDKAKNRGEWNEDHVFNLKQQALKGVTESEFETIVAEKRKALDKANKTLADKRADLLIRQATAEELDKILPVYEDLARKAQKDYNDAVGDKGKAKESDQSQVSLFTVDEAVEERLKKKNKPKTSGGGGSVILPHKERIDPVKLGNNPETRFQEAGKSVSVDHSPWKSIRDFGKGIYQQWTQKYPKLDYKKHADVGDALRRREALLPWAKWKAERYIEGILTPLTPNEIDLFKKKLVLSDMVVNYERGKDTNSDLPFGYQNIEQVRADLRNIDKAMESSEDVSEAFKLREDMMEAVHQQLVDNKLIAEEQDGYMTYFHRRTLQYMQENGDQADMLFGKNLSGSYDFQKKRQGAKGKDFSTNYAESEFKVLTESLLAIENKKLLEKEVLDPYDISKQVNEDAAKLYDERLADLEKTLGPSSEEYLDYVANERNIKKKLIFDVIPEGHSLMQLDPGNNIFVQKLATEQAIEDAFKNMEPGSVLGDASLIMDELSSSFKDVRVVGGKKKVYILPSDIIETLEGIRNQKAKDANNLSKGFTVLTSAWKVNVLLNPTRVLKYNLNNQSGDTDMAIMADPRLLLRQPFALKELWKMAHGNYSTPQLEAAIKYGVINSGKTMAYISDISETEWLRGLTNKETSMASMLGKSKVDKLIKGAKNPIKAWFEFANKYTTIRENVLRYSAFLEAEAQIKKGKLPLWASKYQHLAQINNPTIKAARLARDVVGDYGNVSQIGENLSRRYAPFYRWIEVNMGGRFNQFNNLKSDFEWNAIARGLTIATTKLIGLMARIAAFAVAVKTYNMLFFPEEEKMMRLNKMDGHHLIIGRNKDGTVQTLSFQGAFYDFLQKFGMKDVEGTFNGLMNDELTVSELGKDMGVNMINEGVGSINPFMKGVLEAATRQSYYPNVFNPIPIRDRLEYLSRIASLDKPYRFARGLPDRSKYRAYDPRYYLIYDFDPMQSSYYAITKKIGDVVGWHSSTLKGKAKDKSDALYYYKQSVRLGDKKLADKFLNMYYELGGDEKSMESSVANLHPLANLPKKVRQDVELAVFNNEALQTEMGKTFSKQDLQRVKYAIEWYNKVYKSDK